MLFVMCRGYVHSCTKEGNDRLNTNSESRPRPLMHRLPTESEHLYICKYVWIQVTTAVFF